MKTIRLALLLAVLAVAAPVLGELVDGVVATVGPEVILHSEVMEEIAPLLSNLRSQATTQDAFQAEADKAVREALEEAIQQKILYRQAELAGLKVDDKIIEDRIEKIQKQYGTPEEFSKMLGEAGETMGDFRTRLRKQLLAISMGMHKRKDLEKEAVISETDMRQYYDGHKQEFARESRVKLRRIFLPSASSPEESAKTKARLEALRDEILQGSDFAALARQYSKGPDAPEGGMVGWVSRGDLVPALEAAAFKLGPGEISAVLETEFGFQIMKADENQQAGQLSFDEARTEIEPKLRAKYADERYRVWMDELKKRSRVRVFL